MSIKTYTGGIFDTNCFFIEEHGILIDAPQTSADWLQEEGLKVKTLLLTHGHVDHVLDAARIKREHGCKLGCHQATVQMLTDPDFFKRFGFAFEVEPVGADLIIGETASRQSLFL